MLPTSIRGVSRLPPAAASARLPVIFSPAYDCPEATSYPSTRKQAVVRRRLDEPDFSGRCEFIEGTPATAEQLALCHDPAYIRAVLDGAPQHLAESQGFDWSPAFARSVLAVNGGHLAACRLALERGLVLHLASGAHHARRESGFGFCTFNYLVWCPLALMNEARIARVLIVDLDTHQGDGAWLLTRKDRRFRCFDISGSSMGVPPHHEADGDYWLVGRDDFSREYFECLDPLPDVLDCFKPDLVEYQAGMDCYASDPMAHGVGLNRDGLRRRDRRVIRECRQRNIPTVVNLAGGYTTLDEVAELHLGTVCACLDAMHQRTNPPLDRKPHPV
ncbi:MAG: hypothetical protein HY360_11175 [Verrucomicrobia bacterium]|nr:hypothetical protein [Verrucomicrobiota bacterium]